MFDGRFRNRVHAGRALAHALRKYGRVRPLVIGLPRGGVIVAAEVARALDAALDVWIVRKIGAPAQPELGLGAVVEGGETYLDEDLVAEVGVSAGELAALVGEKAREVRERQKLLRAGGPPPEIANRTVIVVDDGIATGGTVRAVLSAIASQKPARLVLAVPIASRDKLDGLARFADEIVCVAPRDMLLAVGEGYDDFSQTTDEEVLDALKRARPIEQAGRHA